tara:strand:- start:131 stop:583 length:453 start_codon:yes stop_codon:yes gene_type:complete
MPKSKRIKRGHVSRRYRSGLEKETASYLSTRQRAVKYEQLKIEWEDLRYRTYTPDFELDNGIIIETKGLFDSEDRRKHVAIKQQHPELNIRFVFSNASAKLYKGAKSRYCEWCDKNGFLWSHRIIPEAWLKEKGTRLKTNRVILKTVRRD